MAEYTQVHRLVLQSFMREFAFDADELCAEVQKVGDRAGEPLQIEPQALDSFVGVIRNKLSEANIGLEIRKQPLRDLDGKVYYVLVNVRDDEISKAAGSEFKDHERTLFKEILEHLANSDRGDMVMSEAKRLINGNDLTRGKFPNLALEDFLRRLTKRKWLRAHETEQGRYTGGPRTLVELQSTLRDLGAAQDQNTGLFVLRTTFYKNGGNVALLNDHADEGDDDAAYDDSSAEEDPAPNRRRSRQQQQPQNEDDEDEDEDEDDEDYGGGGGKRARGPRGSGTGKRRRRTSA
ncbi:Non-structural maintenance of chromosomes element 1-like [Hondaea fermentalgiana]|uniref:Non-structural maintenance of chromosomes element 1 homolog n=1 Tax=Hondaea fermentalgiana TaxID=2315210 RepID=A0A2R5GIT5_9STRA|nr:Non-structural maintenance of chromosomes element 1-like [Hondaea fermentalgiana]|eukprot:GBG30802.1 Non-structural maintenance of chromosomes element 1-like [Hondaea fermentalgiana]